MKPPHSGFLEIRNPKFSLKKIKGLLFDLDETLYFIPSGEQFSHYGKHLANFLPEAEKRLYLEELARAWDESSPMKVGRAFDPKTEWILEFDDHWRLKSAHTLDGKKVSRKQMLEHYPPKAKEREIEGLLHLASGWGIPTTLARRRGLAREHYRKAYVATRVDMMNDPERFPLKAPKEIPEFFQSLAEDNYILIVATNSDTQDASDVLERLGIKKFFHKIYGEARKPTHSIPLLKEIIAAFRLEARQLLVVGDSVYNDLRDAKMLGAQTVLIERYAGQPLGHVDVRVSDFENFMKLFEK